MKLTLKYFSLFLILAFANFAQAQKSAENKGLPNFHVVNRQLFRGAQPSEAGIKQLAARGVKTVIYLRGADERAETEAVWAQRAGLKFINIPLKKWLEPKDEQIEKILAEINDPENQPVFVHCRRGADRTGTIVAVYRIAHDGWTAEQAINEAKQFGFGWWQYPMKDFIKDYYRHFKK